MADERKTPLTLAQEQALAVEAEEAQTVWLEEIKRTMESVVDAACERAGNDWVGWQLPQEALDELLAQPDARFLQKRVYDGVRNFSPDITGILGHALVAGTYNNEPVVAIITRVKVEQDWARSPINPFGVGPFADTSPIQGIGFRGSQAGFCKILLGQAGLDISHRTPDPWPGDFAMARPLRVLLRGVESHSFRNPNGDFFSIDALAGGMGQVGLPQGT